MRNAFKGLISMLNTSEEIISETTDYLLSIFVCVSVCICFNVYTFNVLVTLR